MSRVASLAAEFQQKALVVRAVPELSIAPKLIARLSTITAELRTAGQHDLAGLLEEERALWDRWARQEYKLSRRQNRRLTIVIATIEAAVGLANYKEAHS